jgi:uncharacterized membrane protein required for colicin V production
MTFNVLDLILLTILAAGAYAGYRVGPLKGSITLLALIVSIVLAFRLMSPAGNAIASTGLMSPAHGAALTFVVLVAGCLTLGWILVIRTGKPSSAKRWGRVGGSTLVFLQAALLISAMLLVLRITGVPSASTRANSLLYRPAVNMLPMMFDSLKDVLPAEQEIEQKFEATRTRGL